MEGEFASEAGANSPSDGTYDAEVPRRILIIDDNAAIHEDFRKVFSPTPDNRALDALEAELFGEESLAALPEMNFIVDTALQGYEGYQKVLSALESGQPYALAFVDMRMPPGWDGVETILHILAKDPLLEVVICSAYSDYSWHEVIHRVNRPGLRLLRKPFDRQDVLELAWTLSDQCLRRRRNEKLPP
jgi:CheY-like chemotaxis protein